MRAQHLLTNVSSIVDIVHGERLFVYLTSKLRILKLTTYA